MTVDRKQSIITLLKTGLETGDPEALSVINPDQYIQHNPQTDIDREGLAALFKEISKTSPQVNMVRIFEDGDYVFGHTEYDFATSRIGFEVFRFEGDQTVEHWDNIQERKGPNPSGRSMVDGQTELTDIEKTESNRALVRSFIKDVLIQRNLDNLDRYFTNNELIQHDPHMVDGVPALREFLQAKSDGSYIINYQTIHRVLAQGNFVLAVSEGYRNGIHTAFYNMFRIENDKLVEHWRTTEAVPPVSEWKNQNGKF